MRTSPRTGEFRQWYSSGPERSGTRASTPLVPFSDVLQARPSPPAVRLSVGPTLRPFAPPVRVVREGYVRSRSPSPRRQSRGILQVSRGRLREPRVARVVGHRRQPELRWGRWRRLAIVRSLLWRRRISTASPDPSREASRTAPQCRTTPTEDLDDDPPIRIEAARIVESQGLLQTYPYTFTPPAYPIGSRFRNRPVPGS